MAKGGYVYIMSNQTRSVLYVGVTANLYSRIYDHKNGEGSAFTKKYNCHDLVYFEIFQDIESAIRREKRIKKYKREWKLNLIKEKNQEMLDLFDSISEFN